MLSPLLETQVGEGRPQQCGRLLLPVLVFAGLPCVLTRSKDVQLPPNFT